jgi:hypothetical protein
MGHNPHILGNMQITSLPHNNLPRIQSQLALSNRLHNNNAARTPA